MSGHLYWAYGSNLDANQVRRRCRAPVAECRAFLPDHRLAFVGYSVLRGGGVASVLPEKGGLVPGLLYRLSDDDLAAMDKWEGHPGFYRRVQVKVACEGGRIAKAWTYVLDRPERAPSQDYVNAIARGYAVLGYPESYLRVAAAAAPVPVLTKVFVYGSLRRQQHNHVLLTRAGARFVREARTEPTFRLHDLGAYPAAVAGGRTALVGEIYEVDEYGLEDLDALKGVPRLYRRSEVRLQCGVYAMIYTMDAAQVAGRREVVGGDWVRRAESAPTEVVRRTPATPCAPGCACPAHSKSDKGKAREARRAKKRGVAGVPGLERVAATVASACPASDGEVWDKPQRVLALPPVRDAPGSVASGGFLIAGNRRC